MKRREFLVTTAAAPALATGLGLVPAMAQSDAPIRIGMTVSSTGTFALAAQSGLRGVEIWVDDVNTRGGIEIGGKKRKVQLVKLDDRSDKTTVPKVYETLIKDEKVDVLFGPFGSTLTAAAVNASETAGKFMVIWSASADSIYAQGFKYIISATQIAGSLLGQPGVQALHALGAKKVAFAYLDEPFPAALTQGAVDLAKQLGMEVTMNEKFAKGTKDFNILIQKAKASGADAFYPTAYEGDQMTIARQLREANVTFKAVYLVYGSQPQFLQQAGKDADYILSQTLLHDKINWKVTHGLSRAQMMERYAKLFPNAQYTADFQTALAYGAGVVTEEVIRTAQSLDAAKLKEAALKVNDKIITVTGEYQIDQTGKQFKNAFSIMQNLPGGTLEVVHPPAVATAKAIYPAPAFDQRK
ncbi:amino acid ABC transporter substrate-binding protein [Reyranella sp. CPCC 100927]|uniref:amino acid ABC transporter substrate-binding protein n=1 Tax=Reyranella sp. CPCC 100927 TaxID=2599616 RepID=UPI0011B46D36|nr:amino acid ABC transporter substrate-binding protein [Reyranella sp. CPCC 100927]TWT10885.1 ABC transporter substrate-binding protein [Reyranella sp. CPCC 100927]